MFAIVVCAVTQYVLLSRIQKKEENLRMELTDLSHKTDSLRIANGQLKEAWDNTIIKIDGEYDYVFLGNSITRNSNFQQLFPNKRILNLGLGGDDLYGIANRAKILGKIRFQKVFVMAGINSVERLSKQEFKESYELLLDSLLRNAKKEQIVIENMLPISKSIENVNFNNEKIGILNEDIKSICFRRDIEYVDLYHLYLQEGELPLEWTRESDGLHIIDEQYAIWAEAISKTND